MPVRLKASFRPRRRASRITPRPRVESLETRNLLSPTQWPGLVNPLLEAEGNDTLDLAHDLGNLSQAGRGEAIGTIGAGADVDWYSFSLERASRIVLSTLNQMAQTSLVSVLSLYNSDPDNFADPYNPLFHRQLAQDDGTDTAGDALLDRPLTAGTYYVAVSGSGNSYFHPYVADSGSEGSTGDYGLLITATDLGFDPAAGPAVVVSEPASDAVLNESPFVLRVGLSAPLDLNSIIADQTVQLFFHPDGTFGDGNEQPVMLSAANLSTVGDELQVLPMAPLGPGYYRLFLAGDSSVNPMVVTDLAGVPLGQNASNPTGQDVALVFQIGGREGIAVADPLAPPVADDTAATARELGALAAGTLVQVAGAIGDDPAYDPASTDPLLVNPANDVDLYHFRIDQPGRHALVAEAFAGRIGSPLDPGLTLFAVDPSDGSLQLRAVNDSTLNRSPSTNGQLPLYTDAVLFAGLTAGDYYLAVSGTGNLPFPGATGVFDPNVSHSGENGSTLLGNYVLNVWVQADEAPPLLVAATTLDGDILDAPPAHLGLQFNEPVNLPWLYQNYQEPAQSNQAAVYIRGGDGVAYYPRLVSYDNASNQAVFLMLDGLPNGDHELHLSGPQGLTDLAGNPLAGNDATDDYVIRFRVDGPVRGTAGDTRRWANQEPNDTPSQPQALGVLFPRELRDSVQIVRDFSADPASAPADSADYYQFEVLQGRSYFFRGRPAGTQLTLRNSAGNLVALTSQQGGTVFLTNLQPGTYVVGISGWTPAQAASIVYQLRITMGGSLENPTALTVGPAPAYRIRLVTSVPPPPAPTGDPNPPPPPAGNANPPPPQNDPAVVPPVTPPPSGETPAPIATTPAHTTETPAPTPATAPPVALAEATPPAVVSNPQGVIVAVNPAPSVPPPLLRLELVLPSENPDPAQGPGSVPTIPGDVSAHAAVPSDVLVVLRGTPLGGVAGPSQLEAQATERLAFRPPQAAPLEGAVRLVVLTQASPDRIADSGLRIADSQDTPGGQQTDSSSNPQSLIPNPQSATTLPPTVLDYLQTLHQVWRITVDEVFGNLLTNWQPEDCTLSKPEPLPQPDAGELRVPDESLPPNDHECAGLDPATGATSELALMALGLGLAVPVLAERRHRGASATEEKRGSMRPLAA